MRYAKYEDDEDEDEEEVFGQFDDADNVEKETENHDRFVVDEDEEEETYEDGVEYFKREYGDLGTFI